MEKNKKKNNIIDFPRKKSKLEREIEAIIFAAEDCQIITKIVLGYK